MRGWFFFLVAALFVSTALSQNTPATKPRPGGPDYEALKAITLPDNPAEEQVEKYIEDILWLSVKQRRGGSGDPQIAMLVRLGPKRVPLLLSTAMKMKQRGGRFPALHVTAALRSMATEEHKKLIVDALNVEDQLFSVIRHKGWIADAKEPLLARLKHHPESLTTEWIAATATFKDPKTYDSLVKHFVHTGNPTMAYNAIKDLPGLKITDAVGQAWQKANTRPYNQNMWRRWEFAQIALQYGHVDALVLCCESLCDKRIASYRKRLREILQPHIPVEGSDEEIARWAKANAHRMVFNLETRKYSIDATIPERPPQDPPELTEEEKIEQRIAQRLAAIRLPENPTERDIREYVEKVLSTCHLRKKRSGKAPEVAMLRKVGSAGLPILLELMAHHKGSYYIRLAVKQMVAPENKQAFVDALAENSFLIDIICENHWEKDAHDVLVRELNRNPDKLYSTWMVAIARLGDPATYPQLRRRFLKDKYIVRSLYPELARLPDFDLDGLVRDAWIQATFAKDPILYDIAHIAAFHGHLEALAFLVKKAAESQAQGGMSPGSNQALFVLLPPEAMAGDVVEWCRKNATRLVFDKKNRRYVLKDTKTP